MRQRNHCSSLKGIPKMKLQDSGPSGPKSLQSQNRPRPENRLSISRLDVVHAQRITFSKAPQTYWELSFVNEEWRQTDAAGSHVRLVPKRAHPRIGSRARSIGAFELFSIPPRPFANPDDRFPTLERFLFRNKF